jgi:hypothetical protein
MKLDNFFSYSTYKDTSTQSTQKSNTDEKKKLTAQDISDSYLAQYQIKISQDTQSTIKKQIDVFTLEDIGYKGKPIGELTQDEAAELVSADGYFGIDKTSQRVSDFVIKGAGDDIDMLKAGRSGVLQGYDEAEKLWGGELPEISQKTMDKTLEMIDAKLRELGVSSIDTLA